MSQLDWEQLLDRFDTAWRGGAQPRLEDYLPSSPSANRRQLLEELIKIDLECRWRRVKASPQPAPPRLEDYLARFPELGPLSLTLIGMEYQARHCWGDRPTHAEFSSRFPVHGAKLREALARIDADLAAEFGPAGRSPGGNASPGRPSKPSKPADGNAPPSLTTVAALVDALRQNQLITPAQLEEVTQKLVKRFPEPRALAGALLKKDWLTAYQVNQLLQGRGGELVLGPYVLLERLGEGGAGQVFKARHQRLNRLVALKVLHKELLEDADVVSRFYREIKVISQLDHTNIVRAHDAGPIGSTHCLAMEYVEGTDLARLVKQNGPLPAFQACDYIRQAALGLQHAHERGLIHRDIKPSNLLLTTAHHSPLPTPHSPLPTHQVVKILDLGLARLRPTVDGQGAGTVVEGHTTTITAVGSVVMMGTPDYLAPEQAINFHEVDIRADIYSLGCTFYYLLTGQPPFPGGTLAQKLWHHQQAEPPDLAARRPDLPPELPAVLRRMLAKQPKDRYQTPAEVAEALATLGKQLPVPPTAGWWRPWLLPRSTSRRILIGAGSMLVLLSLLSWVFLRGGPATTLDHLPGEQWAVVAKSKLSDQPIRSIAFSPDGKLVAAGGDDTFIRLWDPLTNQVQATLKGHEGPVVSLAFAPQGGLLISGSSDTTVRLWDLGRGGELTTLREKKMHPVSVVLFSPDGKTLAVALRGGTVVLWDMMASPRKERKNLDGNGYSLYSLTFSPDGKTLAVTSSGKDVKVWNVATGEPLDPLEFEGVRIAAYAPDGKTMFIGGKSGLLIWEPAARKTTPLVQKLLSSVSRAAFSPDGKLLATAHERGKMVLWDAAAAKPLQEWRLDVNGVAFAPDGRHLAVSHDDGTVAVIRLAMPPKP